MPVEFSFDFKKTLAATIYIASKEVPELTKYKLCKLLFLADKYHLVRYGRIITGDNYWAVPHGPIPTRTLDILDAIITVPTLCVWDQQVITFKNALELDRRFENPRFKSTAAFNAGELSQSDVMALEKTISKYGHMDFEELKAITHSMYAYKQAWSRRPQGANRAIMNFEEFFEEDSDAVFGARDAMLEDDLLRKHFPAHQ
jgi:uncharacterized phage-associated protein